MAISKKLTDYLAENKYKYKLVKHRTTYTAWDTAQTEKVKPGEVAKALVLKTGSDWIVAVLPASKNLDKKKLVKTLNAYEKKNEQRPTKNIEFAKETWMKKNIKVGKLGAIPPFREIVKKEIFADNALLKNKKIYVSSGEYDLSLRINSSEFLKKEKPITGNFSMKK